MKFDNTTPHLSTEYDNKILATIPYYEEIHKETINFIKSYHNSPANWLDTGCGTGTLINKCIKEFTNTAFLLSDPSEEMLTVAKEKLINCKGNISFLNPLSTENIELTEKLDVITAIQAHHYYNTKNRKAATKACYNNLKRDGIYITFENIRPSSEVATEIGKNYWGSYQLSNGKTAEQVGNHLSRFDKEFFPITVSEHTTLYKNCGFKVVELLWYSYMQAGFYCIK